MIEVALFFILLGILIKYGKLYFLIAGYNTLSKEEKEKYDVDGIATVFRNTMFGMAIIMIAGDFLGQWLENPTIEMVSMFIAVLLGLPYLLIQSNSDRFKKK